MKTVVIGEEYLINIIGKLRKSSPSQYLRVIARLERIATLAEELHLAERSTGYGDGLEVN